ncbi:MAG: hypothetical protein AAF889_03215 [Cyanobacteria bacterium P01_D01_bin.73]
MAYPVPSSTPTATADDAAIWQNLKEAIAASSGFQQWQQERDNAATDTVDHLVRLYLRETLETLAY